MEQQILVSVICNTYNHEDYIRDALEGFIKQKTDFKFEVLIHDDASTDKTPEIIREYEKKYPDIIKPIYQTENQYSKGVKISKVYQEPRALGKYIALCEGDDYWTDPKKLQKQCSFLEEHPEYSMCVCATDWLNMVNGKIENRCKIENDMDISAEDIILEKHGRIFQLASLVMRKEVRVDYPDWRLACPIGDLPQAILAALKGKVRMLADVMTVYRWYSKGSWTQRMDNDAHRVNVSKKMIISLEMLDNATNGEYHEVITQRIKRHKYILAVMSHDLKAIKSKELRDIYSKRKWYYKIAVHIRCMFPGFYSFTLKPFIRFFHTDDKK